MKKVGGDSAEVGNDDLPGDAVHTYASAAGWRSARHRDVPAVRGRRAHVEDEVDGDRRQQRQQGESSALSQLAEVELAPRLEPQHEELHQPAVHPVVKIEHDTRHRLSE